MRWRRHTQVMLGVTCLSAGCASTRPNAVSTAFPDAFTAAKIAVAENEVQPEGRQYERALSPWLGPALTPLTNGCRLSAPQGADDTYEWLARLSGSGEVVEVLVRPSSPHSECVRAALRGQVFPPPPRDGYWTGAVMHGSVE